MSERRERAWVVLAIVLGAAAVVYALWQLGAGTGSSAFVAAMALLALPPTAFVACLAGLLLLATRRPRERRGGPRALPLLAYVFALTWTALACLAVLVVGLALWGEDYCVGKELFEPRFRSAAGPEVDLWPPGATCTFTLADGSTVTQTYRAGLYAALGTWLAVTLVLLVSVHVVLTRVWRWWQADLLRRPA